MLIVAFVAGQAFVTAAANALEPCHDREIVSRNQVRLQGPPSDHHFYYRSETSDNRWSAHSVVFYLSPQVVIRYIEEARALHPEPWQELLGAAN